jgi:hypothetical protein
MTFATQRWVCFSAIIAAAAVGCMSSPKVSECGPPGACGAPPADCHCHQQAGCEGDEDDDGPDRWSDEWYAERSGDLVGARQEFKHGKLWPPYPRPTGEEQEFSHRYHASHYWPWPYNCQDQAYVRNITAMHVENGWINETTLYEYHFHEEIHELNHAGQMQLRWILENAPEHHRVVFVQAGLGPHATQARLAAVRNNAVALIGEENLPPIIQRVATPYGRPALEVNRIRQAEIGSMPVPRIQYEAAELGGSGGP